MKSIWQDIKEVIREIFTILDTPFTHLGNKDISVNFVLYILISILLVLFVAQKARQLLVHRVLTRTKLDAGVRQSIGTIVRYLVIFIGFIVIFQSAGLDLTALGVVAGALGVGIGFGLQNITNNFISGIIILLERPIKIGDRVQVGDTTGDVVQIAARATTVVTNDNIAIIIPNSEFISSQVINWSHNDRMVRFRFPFGVSYSEDPERVREIGLAIAKANEGILDSPAADVIFTGYGDSSIDFELWVWTIRYTSRPNVLRSQIYYALFKAFKEANIEIPFPQRDLHIRSGLEVLKSQAKHQD